MIDLTFFIDIFNAHVSFIIGAELAILAFLALSILFGGSDEHK